MATNPHSPKLYDWAHYKAQVSDWKAVTREHVYEDGTKTFNELADYAPQRWTLRYSGMTDTERAVFDAHFEEKKFSNTFTFIDKLGYTHPDCYYESYLSSHDGHRSWSNQVEITIVQYDASNVTNTTTGALYYGADALFYDVDELTYGV